jgi:pimeloyl-ACP methyl ester carboxylesterase
MEPRPTRGLAATVPYVIVPPGGGARPDAPVVVAWHLLDSPRTETAFAAALPLDGLDAWRVYLGLPFTGARSPEGGPEALMKLAAQDVVLKLYGPLVDQATRELQPALDELRQQFGFGEGALGLMGGSIGAAVAQQVIAEGGHDVQAAVLVSPVIQLRATVEADARHFGMTYRWSDESTAVADRLDFVARARSSGREHPPVLVVVGADDEPFREPAAELVTALGTERAELVTVPNMGHALAEEPGTEPAPQTTHASIVDRHATAWFRRHLTPG